MKVSDANEVISEKSRSFSLARPVPWPQFRRGRWTMAIAVLLQTWLHLVPWLTLGYMNGTTRWRSMERGPFFGSRSIARFENHLASISLLGICICHATSNWVQQKSDMTLLISGRPNPRSLPILPNGSSKQPFHVIHLRHFT